MYSDEWMKEGFTREGGAHISGPVSYCYARDKNGNDLGVIVDYNESHDFHYELLIDDWRLFCDKYLDGEDEADSFRAFIEEKGTESVDGLFAFQNALDEAGIKYENIAFSDIDW